MTLNFDHGLYHGSVSPVTITKRTNESSQAILLLFSWINNGGKKEERIC